VAPTTTSTVTTTTETTAPATTTDGTDGGNEAGSDGPEVLPVAQELAWGGCDDVPEPAEGLAGGPECATLITRLDHADPDSPTIELAVARRRATGGAAEGVIVVNPGGPGGSGVDAVARDGGAVPEELRERYDVIGMDTRGSKRSGEITCVDDAAFLLFLDEVDPTPTDGASTDRFQSMVEEFETACVERHREVLPYLGTRFVVRDHEALRLALGVEQITWFGYSYGTLLGTVYAQEFPASVRALVLDGPVVTEVDPAESADISLDGIERTFDRFAAACDVRPDCPFAVHGGTIDGLTEVVARIVEAPVDGYYETETFVAQTGREGSWPFGESRLGYALFGAVYDEGSWPLLESALAGVLEEDWGGRLRYLSDLYLSRWANPPVGTAGEQTFWALRCADREREMQVSHVRERVELEKTELGDPYAGRPDWLSTWRMPNVWCLRDIWPRPAEWLGSAVVDPAQAPPAIAFGATGDFATPIEYLEPLADAVGGAHVVRVESNNHGNMRTNECQQELTVAFVLDPSRPPARDQC
jgi:pimeloyl-ACP methyl ester carboxylesterase